MRLPGYRSLKMPEHPEADAPDYWYALERYWSESAVWWENWTHNFRLSLILWPGLTIIALGILYLVVG